MASIISAGTTSGTALNMTADTSGQLQLATGASATTAITIDTSQNVAFAKGFTVGTTAAPAFAAYNNAAQSFSNSVVTKAIFNTEVFDTNNNFDSTTNYRFTPTVAGYYSISGVITMNNASAGQGSYTLIAKNGTIIASSSAGAVASVSYSGPQVTTLVYMNGTTDYVELYGDMIGATQNSIPTIFATGDGVRFSAFLARSA